MNYFRVYILIIQLYFAYGEKTEKSEYFSITELLPKFYDRTEAPVQNVSENDSCEINIKIIITEIKLIKSETMTFSTNLILIQTWQDYRLLKPENIKLPRKIDSEWLQELWLPDTYILNTQEGYNQRALISNQYLQLHANQTLVLNTRLSLTLSCNMKLDKFPHDVQICKICIRSEYFSMDKVVLRWSEAVFLEPETILPEFDMIHIETLSTDVSNDIENTTVLQIRIHMERRQWFYVFHFYLPSIFEVLMSMLSFAFDVDQTATRIVLLSTSTLALVIQKNSLFIPVACMKAIDIWHYGCLMFVFAAMLEYALVYKLHVSSNRRKESIPRFVHHLPYPQATNQYEDRKSNAVDRISGILFPSVFCVLIIIYAVFYSPNII